MGYMVVWSTYIAVLFIVLHLNVNHTKETFGLNSDSGKFAS